MANPLWFDIRLFAPETRDNKSIKKMNDVAYDHINFMVHLLWGVPYHSARNNIATVHGPVHLLADAMLTNLGSSRWPDQFATAAHKDVTDILKLIKTAAGNTNPKNASVRDLFTEEAEASNGGKGNNRLPVLQHCKNLRTRLDQLGYDICLPFIDAQDRKAFVTAQTFSFHGSKLSELTLMDLYISPILSGTQKTAVVKLIKGGVFRPKSQKSGAIENWAGQGNNYRCDNERCRSHAGCYCSYDSAGNCSAMSSCP